MKRILSVITVIACMFVLVFGVSATNAKAEDVTVSGTIDSGSNGNILKLNTSNGTMDLKIDSSTNFNNVRTLLPGQKLTLKITYGSDAYWHIVSVEEGARTVGVSVDRSNVSTVSGTLTGVISDDVIKLKLQNGEEMHIKLDSDTDYSGTQFLMAGRNYSINVAYGSDAYMHAVSVNDGAGVASGSYSGSSYIVPTTNVSATTTVSGTVGDKSTSKLLYLSTDSGEMQIKLDALSQAYVLYHGQKIKVSIGYANEYWHAVSIQE